MKPAFFISWLLVSCCLFADRACGQLANQPPMPQWLGGSQAAGTYEAHFTHRGKLLKAILFGACDGEMEVALNGRAAGKIHAAKEAVSLDLTQLVREGANVLVIRTKSGRVAALLELNGDLASKILAGDGRNLEGGGWRAERSSDRKAGEPVRLQEDLRRLQLVAAREAGNAEPGDGSRDAHRAAGFQGGTDPLGFGRGRFVGGDGLRSPGSHHPGAGEARPAPASIRQQRKWR